MNPPEASGAKSRTQLFPLLAKEFHRMPMDSFPAIPPRWTDTSWHNDVSPSFKAYQRLDGCLMRAWIDFPELKDRELYMKRFTAGWYDAEWYAIGDDPLFVETEKWSKLIAAIATEIAKCSLGVKGYAVTQTAEDRLALSRRYGAHEVRIAWADGGLPVCESQGVRVSLGDAKTKEEIDLRDFSDMQSAKVFFGQLERFVASKGAHLELFFRA